LYRAVKPANDKAQGNFMYKYIYIYIYKTCSLLYTARKAEQEAFTQPNTAEKTINGVRGRC